MTTKSFAFNIREIETKVDIEDLSLEELRIFHKRKLLEAYELVHSLLSKSTDSVKLNDENKTIIWIQHDEFIRLHTSIVELQEKIRLLVDKNSKLFQEKVVSESVENRLDSKHFNVYDKLSGELSGLRGKVTSLSDTISLFDQEEIDIKKISKIRDLSNSYGLNISSDTGYLSKLLEAWDRGGLDEVSEQIRVTLKKEV
jgi:hypothetical protein